MSKVYLINQYDKWCPENNNGDYIVGVASSKIKAKELIARIKASDNFGGNGYDIVPHSLDKTWQEEYEEEREQENYSAKGVF